MSGRYELAIRAGAVLAQRAADRNDHHGPWEDLLPTDCINWNRQENSEVRQAYACGDRRLQTLECGDLILTGIMAAKRLGVLDEVMEQLAREDGRRASLGEPRLGRMELAE